MSDRKDDSLRGCSSLDDAYVSSWLEHFSRHTEHTVVTTRQPYYRLINRFMCSLNQKRCLEKRCVDYRGPCRRITQEAKETQQITNSRNRSTGPGTGIVPVIGNNNKINKVM